MISAVFPQHLYSIHLAEQAEDCTMQLADHIKVKWCQITRVSLSRAVCLCPPNALRSFCELGCPSAPSPRRHCGAAQPRCRLPARGEGRETRALCPADIPGREEQRGGCREPCVWGGNVVLPEPLHSLGFRGGCSLGSCAPRSKTRMDSMPPTAPGKPGAVAAWHREGLSRDTRDQSPSLSWGSCPAWCLLP